MGETTFDWDDLRLFLAVARHGGLAGAQHETGKSAPTLGRRMLALERRPGQQLFERLARGYELTEQGEALFATTSELENSIYPIVSTANGERQAPVKVSAGTWISYRLCQHMAGFVSRTRIPVRLISADHVLDIAHREAVIGVRNARPTHQSLAGQPINTIRFATYAATEDVQTWARVIRNTPSARWVLAKSQNVTCIEVTDPRNALDMTLAGLTKAVLPTFIGNSQSSLMQVSDEIPELQHEQWLVTHHDDRHRTEVRTVINWIRDVLGNEAVIR